MKTILIIEDDRAVAATYRHKLKEAGFRAEVAPDGLEGIKQVTALKPDAVVLDLLMPKLDGLEVLKFIRSHPDLSGTPVVVFSNSYMTNLVEAAWRAGADECLMKASTMPTQLVDAIKKIMTRPSRRPVPRGAGPLAPAMPAAPMGAPTIDPLGLKAPATPAVAPGQPSTARLGVDSPLVPNPAPAERAGSFTINYNPPAPVAPAAPSPGTSFFNALSGTSFIAKPDTEFHAQIRELFLKGSVARLEKIRQLATAFIQAEDEAQRATALDGLFRRIHALVGNAALAGCTPIAQFSSSIEALLTDAHSQPNWLTTSMLNTVARSVECLEAMFGNVECLEAPLPRPASALVVEVDGPAARPIVAALEGARFKVTATEDPGYAVSLLTTGEFDLVVAGIHLQGTTGFELHGQMQLLPQHAATPIVFVTVQENFASLLADPVVAQHDLIGKPFPSIELTLKALGHLHRRRLREAARGGAAVRPPVAGGGVVPSY